MSAILNTLSKSPKSPLFRRASELSVFSTTSPSPLDAKTSTSPRDRKTSPRNFLRPPPLPSHSNFLSTPTSAFQSPQLQSGTFSPNSPACALRFSGSLSCEALVQSPCRSDKFTLQRRRLYHQDSPLLEHKRRESPATRKDSGNVSLCESSIAQKRMLPQLLLISKDASTRRKSSLDMTPKLGKGGFGSVFIGKYDGRKVAIKQLHNRCKKGESFCGELQAFRLDHPNVVKIITFTNIGHVTQVVYEFVGPNNLQMVINEGGESWNASRRMHLAVDLAAGLEYCHGQGLLHLDVKPTNIILTEDEKHWKVGDFGCCRRVGSYGEKTPTTPSSISSATGGGTLIYKAPEVLKGLLPSTKADVYSYAIVLWQCLSRRVPFEGQHAHTTVFLVVSRALRPDCSFMDTHTDSFAATDLQLLTLARESWDSNPEKRPDFSYISAHLMTMAA